MVILANRAPDFASPANDPHFVRCDESAAAGVTRSYAAKGVVRYAW